MPREKKPVDLKKEVSIVERAAAPSHTLDNITFDAGQLLHVVAYTNASHLKLYGKHLAEIEFFSGSSSHNSNNFTMMLRFSLKDNTIKFLSDRKIVKAEMEHNMSSYGFAFQFLFREDKLSLFMDCKLVGHIKHRLIWGGKKPEGVHWAKVTSYFIDCFNILFRYPDNSC